MSGKRWSWQQKSDRQHRHRLLGSNLASWLGSAFAWSWRWTLDGIVRRTILEVRTKDCIDIDMYLMSRCGLYAKLRDDPSQLFCVCERRHTLVEADTKYADL